MKKRTRNEITVETDEEPAARKPDGLVEAWCPECGELVNSVTTEAAAVLSDMDMRTVQSSVAVGDIHSLETQEGLLLICLNSLLK